MSDYQESTNDDIEEESLLDVVEEEEDEGDELVSELDLPGQQKIMSKEKVYDAMYNSPYTTTNILTKFEKASILGIRASMIANGMGTLVDPGDLTNPIDIARKELEENKIPLMLRRPIPSKNHKKPNFEHRRVSDLQKTI
tara:strand:- start:586 stop:1005 length:420 start_codon:yes stop_codon:yes gene_type:complete